MHRRRWPVDSFCTYVVAGQGVRVPLLPGDAASVLWDVGAPADTPPSLLPMSSATLSSGSRLGAYTGPLGHVVVAARPRSPNVVEVAPTSIWRYVQVALMALMLGAILVGGLWLHALTVAYTSAMRAGI